MFDWGHQIRYGYVFKFCLEYKFCVSLSSYSCICSPRKMCLCSIQLFLRENGCISDDRALNVQGLNYYLPRKPWKIRVSRAASKLGEKGRQHYFQYCSKNKVCTLFKCVAKYAFSPTAFVYATFTTIDRCLFKNNLMDGLLRHRIDTLTILVSRIRQSKGKSRKVYFLLNQFFKLFSTCSWATAWEDLVENKKFQTFYQNEKKSLAKVSTKWNLQPNLEG